MRYASLVVLCALGGVLLGMALHSAMLAKSRSAWIASAAICWQQNVDMRGKLPQWEL